METGSGAPSAGTLAAIRRALEAAGVAFIPENGGGAGVRLSKAGAAATAPPAFAETIGVALNALPKKAEQ